MSVICLELSENKEKIVLNILEKQNIKNIYNDYIK